MTDAFIAVQVLFLLALSGLLRAMPVLVPPTVPFGVRVPSARADEPVITAATRTYRRGTLACGLVVAFASAATNAFAAGSADTLAATAATSLAALFALSWALYYRAHRSIAAAKAEHAWYQDVPQGVAADLLSQAQHERFPWLWALPAVLVTAATAITGAFRYHQLPASLTTHWNSHGRPAATRPPRWAAPSARSSCRPRSPRCCWPRPSWCCAAHRSWTPSIRWPRPPNTASWCGGSLAEWSCSRSASTCRCWGPAS